MNNGSKNENFNFSLTDSSSVNVNKKSIEAEGLGKEQAFAGGNGTENSPYLISNALQLNNVRNYLEANIYFRLTQSIDLSSIHDWLPIGDEKNKFEGKFDGNDYVIRHLLINRESDDCVGLFGNIGSDGCISNVMLVDVNIAGHHYVGGLAGINSGTISGSYVTGNVFGRDAVGGLVGFNSAGCINNSYHTGNIIGHENVGGLVGYNSVGDIQSSYVKGRVIGDNYVGGLIGFSYIGNINDSYVTGHISRSNIKVENLIGFDIGGYINNSLK